MRKFINFFMVIILLLLLVSCNTNTILKQAIHASVQQTNTIDKILKDSGIICKLIANSDNPLIEGMDENWEAYDVISEDECEYLLILRKSDKDFTAILDSENNLVSGIMDNVVLPKYYELKKKAIESYDISNN